MRISNKSLKSFLIISFFITGCSQSPSQTELKKDFLIQEAPTYEDGVIVENDNVATLKDRLIYKNKIVNMKLKTAFQTKEESNK